MTILVVTFPQYLSQYLLQYYTQVKYIFFQITILVQYWYTILEQTNLYASIVHNTSIPVLRSPSTGDPVKPPQILQPVALLMFRVEVIQMLLPNVPIQICQAKLVLCFTGQSSMSTVTH